MRWVSSLLFLVLPMMATAQAEVIYPWQVLASLTDDFDDGAFLNRAILVEDEGEAGSVVINLYIFSENSETYEYDLSAYAPEFVWHGGLIGSSVKLSSFEDGSLMVYANSGDLSPTPWSERIMIVYQDGHFGVSEYFYEARNAEQPDNPDLCYVEFMSGRGYLARAHGEPKDFTHSVAFKPIADWDRSEVDLLCNGIE